MLPVKHLLRSYFLEDIVERRMAAGSVNRKAYFFLSLAMPAMRR